MTRIYERSPCSLACTVLAARRPRAAIPTLARIRSEGLEHSQAAPVFDMLTVNIGPRLTASPAHKRAAEWARDRLASYGLANARLEPWTFGRGWTLEKLTVEMIEPRYLPLIGYADGWSALDQRRDRRARRCFIGGKIARRGRRRCGAQLKGAIVMTQPMMTNFVRKDRPQPSDPDLRAERRAAYATSVGRGPRRRRRRRRNAAQRGAARSRAERRRRRRHPQAERRRARHRVRHRPRRRTGRGAVDRR